MKHRCKYCNNSFDFDINDYRIENNKTRGEQGRATRGEQSQTIVATCPICKLDIEVVLEEGYIKGIINKNIILIEEFQKLLIVMLQVLENLKISFME